MGLGRGGRERLSGEIGRHVLRVPRIVDLSADAVVVAIPTRSPRSVGELRRRRNVFVGAVLTDEGLGSERHVAVDSRRGDVGHAGVFVALRIDRVDLVLLDVRRTIVSGSGGVAGYPRRI